ncbi:L-amino-acid oxidase [Colletotrichum scovillei]|uniref:L-amino acid oxidase n=1 Tax=Colletotrichum scovillei TaxID=1209932 RepID=A0A9P7QUZ4_9PEZI|nr:L-amino-acid oxidase [Colletotrichum scovillei]KAF4778378.1 L-amino-acid oxidase [Colletotrichum scovillei]KAG7038552.1 l-amino acid oxidase [Colletotrichum scovillei]KAG7040731.1 l-amino acid oxidase [Colletotrichum scovillei]KAG7060775.1 l-amino acid oxidase [Colletotrichum scovillei]
MILHTSSVVLAALYAGSSLAATDSQRPLLKDFDALGAWFEEVAAINATSGLQDAEQAKNTTIAIVGAGITGLSTALMLDSVGVHNWELLEASHQIGGRLRTIYVGDTQEWAEMGPMRLPYKIKYKSDNATLEYSDHAMTFQLADWLNEMNQDSHTDLNISFIPWIQHSPNELLALGTGRHPDGSIPTRADIAANSSLGRPAPMNTQEYKDVKAKMSEILLNEETLREIQKDVWRVHGRTMKRGLDDVSQQSMMRNVWNASAEVADAIHGATDYDVFWDEMHHNSNLAQDGSKSTLGETEWRCVDGGFSRFSDAFLPHVQDRLVLNRQVRAIEAVKDGQNMVTGTKVSWIDVDSNRTQTKPGPQQSKTYDYTMLAVPFTMTRMMRLPSFSPTLSRAMAERGLRFKDACKVGLLFSERFWEKGDRPIFGGYSTPPDAAVGALYYPVYGHNESGRPGLILHYRGGDWSSRFASLSEEQHVGMVLDAVASLHGEQVRELYTGVYERLCWLDEPFIATAWTRPDVAQHALYIPAYHRTESNVIVLGEHTAPTHAWISSSLYSAVRGAVQLLLEIGLVDEAKQLNQRWMGRWIDME